MFLIYPSLFVEVSGFSRVYLVLYVDDIIITGDSEDLTSEVMASLQAQFDMKDLGDLHFFIGLEIRYLKDRIFLSEHKYTKDLIHKAGMDACHTHVTPCQSGIKLLKDSSTPFTHFDITPFRSLVGCL
ncbi:uncharacterized mitochondrial protein AtMg00810-like [Rosa rugosa]|uniref:uncharacterized mitochondrial protein AtMg00810-like n=1 Tax=Rosa rugosa TaxID=74645 RepID=UPI002B416E61|nr:uncharacterized mitochondrial protein AtMg00810-like [Rosa rugosa]